MTNGFQTNCKKKEEKERYSEHWELGYVFPCVSIVINGNGKDIKKEISQAMASALLRKCWLATELTLF